MVRTPLFSVVLVLSLLVATSLADDAARIAFEKLVAAKTWQERSAVKKDLVELGTPALDEVQRGAERHEDVEVRRTCYEILMEKFMEDASSRQAIAQKGLEDEDGGIRYSCAFSLGTHKVYAAHRKLRRMMDDKKESDNVRLAAAKSLAQLGEPDVIRKLYYALESDQYMERYMANIGIEALSGKDLDDFGEYKYHEDSFVSGGAEFKRVFDAASVSAQKAKRYQALAAYCKWLQAERPELYKHLTY